MAELPDAARDDLLARWSEPHRRHHDVTHLREVLDAIDLLAADGLVFDREAVRLAAWFHDAVYVVGRDDNEERSAALAGDVLAASPLRDDVVRLVLATTTHKVAADDTDAAVLSDADLSVLGSPPSRYQAYARAVREEYADIPDEVFRPARARILSALADGAIFHTAPGARRWEAQARANLTAEIEALTR